MTDAEKAFFAGHEAVLPVYEALRELFFHLCPGLEVRVSKTQVSFLPSVMAACVSFLPARRKAERPPVWLTLTLCLPYRIESARIAQCSEPYPMRWTHHIMLSSVEEVDDELASWAAEAFDWALERTTR